MSIWQATREQSVTPMDRQQWHDKAIELELTLEHWCKRKAELLIILTRQAIEEHNQQRPQ